MKTRTQEICSIGSALFEKRRPILTLWQSMAENFYPIRADFTYTRAIGVEFASNLMTGRPTLAHRDLSNSLSAMLRPRGKTWFHARTDEEKVNEDAAAKQWLDAKSAQMVRAMYDRRAQFIRATKEGDMDFTAFGQCVISLEPNADLDGILYRCWHLKDVAWCENAHLEIDTVHRNQKLEARQLVRLFPKTVSENVKRACEKSPGQEISIRHVMMPADEYDLSTEKAGRKNRLPYVSLFVDIENDTIMEEVPARDLTYIIPRWVTISGSQYAHSPATVTALPDARMLQQIGLTLLEAGQKAVDPPLKATKEAIVGGVNVYAGGITWVDAEYDEKMGVALEPLMKPSPGLNWGDEREAKIETMIKEAFFLDQITAPYPDGTMTATEFRARFEEYIRRALPLFEPMEVEYNGQLCEKTFDMMMHMNAFGPMDDMPPILAGRDIRFQFESPLQGATERAKATAFTQAMELLKMAAEVDPAVRADFNLDAAFRDALVGTEAPADWIVPEKEAEKARAELRQMQAMQQAASMAQQGAAVAQQVGDAQQALVPAGAPAGAA